MTIHIRKGGDHNLGLMDMELYRSWHLTYTYFGHVIMGEFGLGIFCCYFARYPPPPFPLFERAAWRAFEGVGLAFLEIPPLLSLFFETIF